MVKRKYEEGTWFAVPLRTSGFAIGVIARKKARYPILLGYFFGPKRDELPSFDETRCLSASAAIEVCRFGDLHVHDGTWPLLGLDATFRRENWPFPKFGRVPPVGACSLIEYGHDPASPIRQTVISHADAVRQPQDCMCGAGSVEIGLTRLLDSAYVSARVAVESTRVAMTAQHFVYFKTRSECERAAERLPKNLSHIIRRAAEGSSWLLLITQTASSNDEGAFEDAIEAIAPTIVTLGGDYDGWERDA
jgi:hypothetical protein